MCDCITTATLDSITPYRVHLTAYYKRSFANYTVKERMPVILTKLIDGLVRDKEEIVHLYGEESREEIKAIIGEISKLKYEIQTNKAITKLNTNEPDAVFYNNYLDQQTSINGELTYYSAIWLHAECYMYRKLRYFFEITKTLNTYDPFFKQKKSAFQTSLDAIISLSEYLIPILTTIEPIDTKSEFFKLLKINLWGNRCDLSISGGDENSQTSNPFELLNKYDSFILSNHSENIWKEISKNCLPGTMDFINDNAGYEMFTDFCLADFLTTFKLATQITFHIKTIPWFISDTTDPDVKYILRTLINHENPFLKKFGIRWNKYIRNGIWIVKSDPFWTLPVDYTHMKSVAPDLYAQLSESRLLIFKGDLNYRKLFGEKNWEPTTCVEEALQGFVPTRLCTLRTIKADIVCGLEPGVADELTKKDIEWMTTGNYGVIQYVG